MYIDIETKKIYDRVFYKQIGEYNLSGEFYSHFIRVENNMIMHIEWAKGKSWIYNVYDLEPLHSKKE